MAVIRQPFYGDLGRPFFAAGREFSPLRSHPPNAKHHKRAERPTYRVPAKCSVPKQRLRRITGGTRATECRSDGQRGGSPSAGHGWLGERRCALAKPTQCATARIARPARTGNSGSETHCARCGVRHGEVRLRRVTGERADARIVRGSLAANRLRSVVYAAGARIAFGRPRMVAWVPTPANLDDSRPTQIGRCRYPAGNRPRRFLHCGDCCALEKRDAQAHSSRAKHGGIKQDSNPKRVEIEGGPHHEICWNREQGWLCEHHAICA